MKQIKHVTKYVNEFLKLNNLKKTNEANNTYRLNYNV